MSTDADALRARAYQGYLRGLRTVWKGEVYRRVLDDARGIDRQAPADIEHAMRAGSPDYRLYGWLERHLQQFKYFGRYGMVTTAASQAGRLAAELDAAALRRPDELVLDASLRLPDYYVGSDFHQHAGGVWSDDYDAFVYESAADRYSFALQDSSGPYAAFARHVIAQRMADGGRIGSVLDLGCGFGKSTLPFCRLDPEIAAEGVDLAAPCLRLAHLRAVEEGVRARFRQCAAESLPHPDRSVDAVVCYWLLHELPADVARQVLAEAFRVLRPGGLFASRDMHTCTGGAVGRFLHYGHAARNNEPFLADCDVGRLRPALAAAGFVDVRLAPCDADAPGLDEAETLARERVHVNTILQGRKPDDRARPVLQPRRP